MEFKLIRTNRKTVAIQVNPDLSITVRAPRYASKREIDRIVEKNEAWIHKHIEIIEKKLNDPDNNEDLIKTLDVLNKKIDPQ